MGDYYLLQLGVCPAFSNLKFSMTYFWMFSLPKSKFLCHKFREDVIIILTFLGFSNCNSTFTDYMNDLFEILFPKPSYCN